jgi:hypothetical protein
MSNLQQAINLNSAARTHEALGNALLASWMVASALPFQELDRRTNESLDRMALGNYPESPEHSRRAYARDWYEYEDEYQYNFCGY